MEGKPMSRAEKLARVPLEARLEISSKNLTGAMHAYGLTLRQTLGDEKYHEFEQALFYEAGRSAKPIVDTFELAAHTVKDFAETISCIGTICFGPGYQSRIVETGATRCVGRTRSCPIRDRMVEAGITEDDSCHKKHKKYVEGLLDALNLDFTFNVTNHMAAGESYCEWSVSK
jgi:hypothetical protein